MIDRPPVECPAKPMQSSLVLRFVNNDFQENKEPTIGGTLFSLTSEMVLLY